MSYKKIEIKNGITVHNIKTDKFKTNLIAIFLTTSLNRDNVTLNSMLSSILRCGTQNMPSKEEISKKMEEMYGASFDCGLDKTGDNHILKFYLESLNDEYIPKNDENLLKDSINKLIEIVFNPYIEKGYFKKEYVEQEKENVKQRIKSKIDNKSQYAKFRCIEEMYKNMPAGLYKYGYTEDLENINEKILYEYYKKLINECKIDIFVSGKIKEEETLEILQENDNIKNLSSRTAKYKINTIEVKKEVEEREIIEKQDVSQGKIVIGCDILFTKEDIENKNIKYQALIYNSLLRTEAQHQSYFKM